VFFIIMALLEIGDGTIKLFHMIVVHVQKPCGGVPCRHKNNDKYTCSRILQHADAGHWLVI